MLRYSFCCIIVSDKNEAKIVFISDLISNYKLKAKFSQSAPNTQFGLHGEPSATMYIQPVATTELPSPPLFFFLGGEGVLFC